MASRQSWCVVSSQKSSVARRWLVRCCQLNWLELLVRIKCACAFNLGVVLYHFASGSCRISLSEIFWHLGQSRPLSDAAGTIGEDILLFDIEICAFFVFLFLRRGQMLWIMAICFCISISSSHPKRTLVGARITNWGKVELFCYLGSQAWSPALQRFSILNFITKRCFCEGWNGIPSSTSWWLWTQEAS